MPMLQVTDEGTGEQYSVPIQSYLSELLLKLQVNQAENILFSSSEKMTDAQFFDLGNWFYNCLEELSEEELKTADFSRIEISQGRIDLKQFSLEKSE